MKKILKLFPAQNNFNDLFLKEKERLEKLLNQKIEIEHIGSTAVPGLSGKGIIDIIIGAEDSLDLSLITNKLIKNGYHLDLDNETPENRVFLASREHDSTLGDYHIHVVIKDRKEWKRLIFFRDKLRNDKKVKSEYENLKNKLYTETNADRRKYKILKEDFINNVLKEMNE